MYYSPHRQGKTMDWLFSNRDLWVYFAAGELALFFNIFHLPITEKRNLRWLDVYSFFVWSFFVGPAVIIIGISPFLSCLIGWGCQTIWKDLETLISMLAPNLANLFISRGNQFLEWEKKEEAKKDPNVKP